ncbi:substrate-binding domain-containing protein [Arthrobacter sp.]|uniref:LacI family DNA-binding transcriptional regulator n=1 Tax=Arthrobacter sp. TaxID=1667 RepID=UPI00339932BC
MTATRRNRAATLHDVAREAGVSLATASRSLNGSTRKVNEAYREKVLDAARRLGYTTNFTAQAVARGNTMTVALLVADIGDPYFSSLASGVIAAAEEAGLVVTIAVTGRDPQRELDTVRALRGQRPRVIILPASRTTDSPCEEALRTELKAFEDTGGRVTFISQVPGEFPYISLDNYAGAKELALELVGIGYRRFGAIVGPSRIRTVQDRLRGFADGLAEHDLGLAAEDIFTADFTRDGGYDAARAFAQRGLNGLELVFAANDVMAMGALTAFRDAGIEPGEEIAVAGYDDIPTVRDVSPPLTTVHIPLEAAGRLALQLALGEADAGPAQLSVPSKVVIRASTPPRPRP